MRFFIGLRGRLMLALLAVTVVALGGAAIALFSPLERRLRDDALTNLSSDVFTARQALAQIPRSQLTPHSAALRRVVRSLRRIGSDVTMYDRNGRLLLGGDPDSAPPPPLTLPLPAGVGTQQQEIIGSGAEAEARVVTQTKTRGGGLVTLVVSRSLKDVQGARDVFVVGFERAAAVSLLIAAVLGFLLATRLVRRTRALRGAALRVASEGPGAAPPDVAGRDEIGDLARAFATMQERLGAQEEARKAFVATASHELRTPIAALQLRLGLLSEDLAADGSDVADAREQIAHAEAQASRLAKLASDLLDLSRLDATVALRSEQVQLGSLCHVTIAEFDPVPGPPIVLDDHAGGSALADPGKVSQIVRILVDNARGFAPPQQPVRVIVDGATIAVEDDGPGVAADEREVIFDRFRRGSGREGGPGFGLGLAIGRELARRMGGELRLCSRVDPTRFELVLRGAGEGVAVGPGDRIDPAGPVDPVDAAGPADAPTAADPTATAGPPARPRR
ncbi:MAG: histidine kinase [Conexibacter sp.]|nr:histidine kinase [Conexibacter sp.]